MGVKNWGDDVIPWRWTSASSISPGTLAIDVPNYLSSRMAVIHRMSSEDSRISMAHIGPFFSLLKATLKAHILPVFIFDGPPETRKRVPNPGIVRHASQMFNTFQQNRDPFDEEISSTLRSSPAVRAYFAAEHLRHLGSLVGVPTITAPSEAEMLAAVLCREGMVNTVLSSDVDALLFGSPHVTKRVQFSSDRILCVSAAELECNLGLDIELIRDLAVISGCDFHKEGVKGIGVRRGIVLLQKYGSLVELLKSRGYSYHERKEFIDAREVFDEATFLSAEGMHLRLNPPIVSKTLRALEAVMSSENAVALIDEILSLWRSFGIRQSTLEQWF